MSYVIKYIKHKKQCLVGCPNTEKRVENAMHSRFLMDSVGIRGVWIADEILPKVLDR